MNKPADFWSRRRNAVLEETASESAVLEAEAIAQEHAALEDLSEAEVLERLDLPNPDTLKQGDDFSAFMAKAVPEAIRRRALRTLWRSNPVLANVDMLVDYGEDFTDSAMVVENMQTAYQVGKGMLKHIEEMARQAAEKENPAAVEDDVDGEEDEPAVAAPEEAEPIAATALNPEHGPSDPDVEDVEVTYAPRRMTFQIEETA
ncbi:DUF3306 domain-containing protein [Loktanella sp. Alg231-35]|uniref:DUF3306 domain-containing protein n=1 Tax=Loktanella sp. Alg231-35 TaxID=1922220 RepID=UPI000D5605DA|nr:DUF3306 domain-containing protein [Loktanella sp. Alg231-35]